MKLSEIFYEIPQLSMQITQLIQQKTIVAPFRFTYAISKTGAAVRKLEVSYNEFRESLIKKYCELDPKGKPKTTVAKAEGQPDRHDLIFNSPKDKEAFTAEIKAYMDKDIDFVPHSINMSEVEAIQNIPPAVIDTLIKYKIMVE